MDLKILLNKGLTLKYQQPGLPADGPITPCLKSMAAADNQGAPISPVGADVARLFSGRRTLVVFAHTAGSGITPWRRLIVLDAEYKGEGQVKSPARIGLVAHELTHLLQRELRQPYYWPSGGLRPGFSRRWVGDSTNYMEVLAYLVGWTVEYDLIAWRAASPDLAVSEREGLERAMKSLRDRLTTLSGNDARNACRLVVKTFLDNGVHRKNYTRENRLRDGRIPPGGWHAWLHQLGFSYRAVDHLFILAAQGKAAQIELGSLS
jgi:hypothetical protein